MYSVRAYEEFYVTLAQERQHMISVSFSYFVLCTFKNKLTYFKLNMLPENNKYFIEYIIYNILKYITNWG